VARAVFVTSEPLGDLPAGGITTFIHHFGRLLLGRGEEVTWLVCDPSGSDLPPPRTQLETEGADVVHVRTEASALPILGPDLPFLYASTAVADALPEDADVVYFQDWGAQGFIPVRRRRLLARPSCPFVTVMHGASDWVRMGMQAYPKRFVAETTLSFAERYATERSDFVVAPSEAMRRWLTSRGWSLGSSSTVLGFPMTPWAASDSPPAASAFRRLIYFGRLQTVKGLEVFVAAVARLAREGRLAEIEEVVLLGSESRNRIGRAADVVRVLEQAGLSARAVTDRDSVAAQAFLAEHRGDSLVVIPSLVENFPFAVIEATLMPGLSVICSRVGGIPEILAGGERQLFDPHPGPLAAKIAEFLEHGPLPEEDLARYDVDAANDRWLRFHERVLASRGDVARRAAGPPAPGSDASSVDVCVVHHDQGQSLPHLLASLEAQTVTGFTVSVVDDGSTDPASLAAFARMEELYAPRGWRFVRQEREDVGAARNTAARLGDGEYLLFIDADDVAAPNLVEAFAQAAIRSGADCLGCYACEFELDGAYPLDANGSLTAEATAAVEPAGGALATALVTNPYGLAVSLVRRSAFEAVGGYTIDRWIGYEDYELYVRLVSAGYDVDVVPTTLVYHRRSPLAERDSFRAHERVLRVFRERLAPLGLAELPDAVCGLEPPVPAHVRRARAHGAEVEPRVPAPPTMAERAYAILRSRAGWAYADRLAQNLSWRVLVGALVVKARHQLVVGRAALASELANVRSSVRRRARGL
jgi:glycosyltransferase involved in cell wall biosynthesis/GT2 family glycosyltransferase